MWMNLVISDLEDATSKLSFSSMFTLTLRLGNWRWARWHGSLSVALREFKWEDYWSKNSLRQTLWSCLKTDISQLLIKNDHWKANAFYKGWRGVLIVRMLVAFQRTDMEHLTTACNSTSKRSNVLFYWPQKEPTHTNK